MYACLMYNVYAADSPQCGRNDGHFVVIQQSDETSDDPGIDHFLDSLVGYRHRISSWMDVALKMTRKSTKTNWIGAMADRCRPPRPAGQQEPDRRSVPAHRQRKKIIFISFEFRQLINCYIIFRSNSFQRFSTF